MNRNATSMEQVSQDHRDTKPSGIFSKCPSDSAPQSAELQFGKELIELCIEVSGALLRGYSDGKSGRKVRILIVDGLEKKIGCQRHQAQSIVDLALEMIHYQAFGRFKQSSLELSLLAAKCEGRVDDVSLN